MCGIVALVGSREASPILLEGLKKLEYRGYDSAGLATVNTSKGSHKSFITCKKAKGKLINLLNLVEQDGAPGHIGIGHTRWATHGKPLEQNAHPHMDSVGEVAVVQNGIIENYTLLKKKLEDRGISFSSDTDTEVIPHLISEEIKRLKKDGHETNDQLFLLAVQTVLDYLEGSYALAVIWTATPDALIVAKSKAPLLIGFGEGEFLCASDTPAFAGFTRAVLSLEDQELALLTPLGVEIYNSSGERQYRSPSFINGYESDIEKGNFRHFMLKEIFEQPATADLWISRYLPDDLPVEAPVALPFDNSFFDPIEEIQILACGTSRHAAMVGAYLLEQFAGIPTTVFFASEFRYAAPPLAPNTLTIGVTQSGETADTLSALAMEHERRSACNDIAFASRQLGVTNMVESSLARQVSNILDIGAGLEVGVAATKTFLGQLLTFYGLAIMFAARRKARSANEILDLCNQLRSLPKQLRNLIETHNELTEKLSHQFSETKDVIFLGRGINYPIALEAALKLKEISYIHAEGYPAGEMKHGPIALLDKKVAVVSIATKGIVFEKALSNAQEAKARDACLIGIGPKVPETDIFDHLLPIPQVSEWISPLLTIIPMQLLSYHIAAHRGLDVDQPRNLAKSVTVE
ncbi:MULTISPECIES: glutamine--fructose-6-phosphate transaminase (isomerizing) [Prochlorococcus]|uniref:Glutamine--fructose-6-phosphate aminotransferase [isomerizing] n=1 Tax=Prochlorococcus marinus (strain SARG / CCMP1375 / SS120) TaxID=167539 RepID=Q7V9R2_PROMA|nr:MULTISPECIES: glutamine--fructose-6-phosphate transaminase (isomerizing) [Prochlorococcus]AAQ00810.1 Glucosamine 6-phosphate synthetase [Prochlorococcus marinus subsp. marinus str. CCMP1375]KGG10695.1 Glucosamine--fructose-6-phosphate aminotransferase (isomerizing) [Prochlorococcus marinus str. LG]KGG21116.1 Glucosamine--fructose-6-phosphate aminotransferase (isomerizing) [Prochlorococcus marinus str. SS2]KGG23941.1 Glucosamine--fructose-6-phosphate aminotransferase (isomerizing) [Prochloroc